MKVIINADDCGIDSHVNQHIMEAIDEGKLTSTTIMANMEDLDGSFCLYEKYHDKVSFGIHLNLTQGEPLIKSKTLLDYGYYSIIDDKWSFNKDRVKSLKHKLIPKCVKCEIFKELSSQIEKVKSGGVNISHIDSHHFIHTYFSLMDVIAQISKDYDIPRIRRIRNYIPRSLNYYERQIWATMSRFTNRRYLMTDYFAGFKEFFSKPRLPSLHANSTVELMVHVGHFSEEYQNIEKMMLMMTFPNDVELINYNEL